MSGRQKPWKIHGDNLFSHLRREEGDASITDMEALKKQAQKEQFNERTVDSPPYGSDEVRFTVNNNNLYIFVLNPQQGAIELPALGLESENHPGRIKSIRLLGGKGKINFKQSDEKLEFTVPKDRPNKYTSVFEVKGAL